jgi:hypothetical protein
VQTLQACGQWDLDPSPNGGVDIFEFDADAGDAIDKVHDADYSELLVLLKLPHGGVELPNRRSSENPTNNPHPPRR